MQPMIRALPPTFGIKNLVLRPRIVVPVFCVRFERTSCFQSFSNQLPFSLSFQVLSLPWERSFHSQQGSHAKLGRPIFVKHGGNAWAPMQINYAIVGWAMSAWRDVREPVHFEATFVVKQRRRCCLRRPTNVRNGPYQRRNDRVEMVRFPTPNWALNNSVHRFIIRLSSNRWQTNLFDNDIQGCIRIQVHFQISLLSSISYCSWFNTVQPNKASAWGQITNVARAFSFSTVNWSTVFQTIRRWHFSSRAQI